MKKSTAIILLLISQFFVIPVFAPEDTGSPCSENSDCTTGNCFRGICEERGYCEEDYGCSSGRYCYANRCRDFVRFNESSLLFILWILVLYLMPLIYFYFLNRVDMELIGTMVLMIITSLVFPAGFYTTSGHAFPFGSHFMIPPFICILVFWNFFADGLDLADKFLLSIISIYVPAAAAAIILLIAGIFEFSWILPIPFIAPVAAYILFKHLGYITSCIFFVNYLLFDLQGALIVSGLSAASIILYKSRFRRIERERFDDISIEETINTGMPLFTHTGFSEVKNYSKIPDDAIDPYTLDKIHDLLAQGKRIVKCNSCGTYYDREVLNFYGNSCAVFGCSNSQL
ncbi:hypothetical protein BEH94_03205 [Candidatus Altiarchaeales archaeon WOR_SM1_SCG]|nr:hypothetical protein BEH94_03205 [Candidatus Altiarchaeales archaeon WOR_SM1_SCG]